MESFLSSVCRPLNLQFMDVAYHVNVKMEQAAAAEEKIILKGITGEACPGEVLAVLGPTGSGKSTLLSILGGRLLSGQGRHTGTVLADGRAPCRAVKRRTGFVAQDDVLHPHLTVRETLVFCAMLRLPASTHAAAKTGAAEAVIAELGLGACADTMVVNGVSGGERKRVSIGQEMLADPSLLILDEPTSGLDSTAAVRLVATISALARKGRTVVMSVHQPSGRLYRSFDSLLLLAEGSCLYHGPRGDAMDYFASLGFAPGLHVNPTDFMVDLANGFAEEEYYSNSAAAEVGSTVVKQLLISSYNRVLAPKVKSAMNVADQADEAQAGAHQQPSLTSSWTYQFRTLLRRSLKQRRHETFTSLHIFQVLAAAVVVGAMWWRSAALEVQDRKGLLFIVPIFWGYFAALNAVFEFPQERHVLARERASGMYELSSYFMSRMVVDLPMQLALPVAFTVIVYLMAGLNPAPAAFALTLAVVLSYVLVAEGLGLAVGAVMIADAKRASTLVTVIMFAGIISGGFYVQHVPAFLVWAKYTSFTYYCYRLLIAVQYSGHLEHLLPSSSSSSSDMVGEASTGICVSALLAMFFGYRLLAFLALRRIRT